LQGIFFWDLVIYLIEGPVVSADGFSDARPCLGENPRRFPLDEILVGDRAGC